MPLIEVSSMEQYNELLGSEKVTVALFTASWAEQCRQVEHVVVHMSQFLEEHMQFVSIIAESFPELSMELQVDRVPTVIIFKNRAPLDRVVGVNIEALTKKSREWLRIARMPKAETLNDYLKELINKAPIMIFMKGDRNLPRCTYSGQMISIMNETGLPYETFDILWDENVREGLKLYSDWPTFPQLYVKGVLIGGVDIVKEMKANGELGVALNG